jgi:hypothetical protein
MIAVLIPLVCADDPCALAAWHGQGAMAECHRALATLPRGTAVCVGGVEA